MRTERIELSPSAYQTGVQTTILRAQVVVGLDGEERFELSPYCFKDSCTTIMLFSNVGFKITTYEYDSS